jgi:hypothetical protein
VCVCVRVRVCVCLSQSQLTDYSQTHSIASDFSKTYKSTIKQFDAIVIKSFQNAALAITVAKLLFKVLLLTYPRFHMAVKTRFDQTRDRPSWLRNVVGTGAVMVEVKRYHRLV